MYTQITFYNVPEALRELLIANLQEDAEGFEEEEQTLKAIFLTEKYDDALISNIAATYPVSFEKKEIQQQNWNALWESNFEPVVIDRFVGIRASFHQPLNNVLHEIVITPKMSFGTGHHATTYLMLQQMAKINFRGKRVFDFGTGTGVLAILAKKLGAAGVIASDIDEWSIQNAKENFEQNQVKEIQLLHSASSKLNNRFDIILANINRNVLLENIPVLSAQLNKSGLLLLSGILIEDEAAITACCSKNGLTLAEKSSRDKWICLAWRS